MCVLKIHYKYASLPHPIGVYSREFIHKNDAINRGRNDEFGTGDSNSCIIAMSPTSSTTENQEKVCVVASTHSGERGTRGVCSLGTFSSRTVSKGTGQLRKFCKNATSHIRQFVCCETFLKSRPKRLSGKRNLLQRSKSEVHRQPSQ